MKLSSIGLRRVVLVPARRALVMAMAFVVMRSGPLAPTRVTVVQATEGRLTPALFGIGTVEARRSYLIGPTVAGRVRAVAVDVGDTVKAGQLLAEMDPVDLDERAAALDASVARAGSAMAAADAQRRDAQAARNWRRSMRAATSNWASRTSSAPAPSRPGCRSRHRPMRSSPRPTANLAAARQDQQRLAAERAGLRQQRANVRLLAPADGVVTSRDAEPGSTVVAGQAVLRLIEPSSLWVKVRLDQGRSAGLAAGLPAQVVLRSNPGQALAGKVARVEAVSDSVTEERVAQVSFDQAPASLSVGELAEVTLSLPSDRQRRAAAQRRRSSACRRRPACGRSTTATLRFAPVRIGQASLDGQVQVLEGLKPGTTSSCTARRTSAPQPHHGGRLAGGAQP
jgi:HlyD family secretion protein